MIRALRTLVAVALAASAGAVTIDEFTVNALPAGIGQNVTDNSLWYGYNGGIARITTATVPSITNNNIAGAPRIADTVVGSDGRIWGTERGASKIVAITLVGAITEYSTGSTSGTITPGSIPLGICATATDLWFCERGNDAIGRINTAGSVINEYAVPSNAEPKYLCVGGDGKLWFTASGLNQIGRLDPASPTTAPTMYNAGAGSQPLGICLGPDGAVWFTEPGSGKIGRMDTSGTLTEYTVPTTGATPYGICNGPDNNLWFCEYTANQVVRLTISGVFTEIALPTGSSGPTDISSGPDNKIWLTEETAGKIARLDPSLVAATTSTGTGSGSASASGSGTSVAYPTNSGGGGCGLGAAGAVGVIALLLMLRPRRSRG